MRAIHVAASAVLVVSASALADPFTLSTVFVRPDNQGWIEPSSGSFVTQLPLVDMEDAYVDERRIAVLPHPSLWSGEFDYVMTSTWLAVDPYGPYGRTGADPYGTGWATYFDTPSGVVHAPTYAFSLGGTVSGLAVNGLLGDPVNGDGLSPGFVGGVAGFAWGPSKDDSFQARSLFSYVNGRGVDSSFVGHFVLSDPTATLAGPALIVAFSRVSPGPEAATLNALPLDGSAGRVVRSATSGSISLGAEVPIHLESERTTFTNSLGTFTAIDLYIVSTGPYPTIVAPPDEGDDEGDDDGGDGDEPDDGDGIDPYVPPIPPPAPVDPGDDDAPPVYFTVSDVALVVRAGDSPPEVLHDMLVGAGLDPSRYTAKEWKKLMTGFYDHRVMRELSPKPTKQERKDAIASLIATYGIEPEMADLTDTGTQDADGNGQVEFADVARILEVGGASRERLAETLALLGLEADAFPSKKAWKATVRTFYEGQILSEFVGQRTKKQQSGDRKSLYKAR